MPGPVFLLLKAIIPGGASASLFDTPVEVAGYTTKQGTYVAPHHSRRRKKLPETDAPLLDFGKPADAGPVKVQDATPHETHPTPPPPPDLAPTASTTETVAAPSNEAAIVEHVTGRGRTLRGIIRRDLTLDQAKEIDPYTFRKDGGFFIREKHVNAVAAAPPAQPGTFAPEKPNSESSISAWGVPAGTSKKERRALNRAALALLASKTDDQMTADDLAALARYTGDGGIGDSPNEYYTEPAVAAAMWSMVATAGFRGGDVLEPSCGTGVFMHTAPASARLTGVEMSPVSSRIARLLHPNHDVPQPGAFEFFATQDGRLFDAVIGNPPFGIRGSLIREDKSDLGEAERYFLDTALDKTKDGGLVALILPSGVMDSANGRAFRQRILCKGEFLGAHRLPNTAFAAAHTGVTTDVVLFRKRPQEVAGALATLDPDQLRAVGVHDDEFVNGQYFTDGRGRANVMGKIEAGWREKAGMGHDITVTGAMDGVPAALATARLESPPASPSMETVLGVLEGDEAAIQRAVSASLKPPYQPAREGDIRVIDGVRYVLQGSPLRWHRCDAEIAPAVRDARAIAESLDDLIEGRARDPRLARANLIELLDDYIAQHGLPAKNKALLAWLAAPHLDPGETADANEVGERRHRIARLLGAVKDSGEYSDLVTGRRIEQAPRSLDAVATSLAIENGAFTAEQLAAETGQTAAAVLDHLFAAPDFTPLPDGSGWTTLDAYLAGDMWPKLDAARAAVAHEGISPEFRAKYEGQARALEAAIAPQCLEDVPIDLNSGFIAAEDLQAWMRARGREKGYPSWQRAKVDFDGTLWTIDQEKPFHGDKFLPKELRLIETYLNRTGVRKTDKPLLDRLNEDFAEWVRQSDRRDEIEERYNRTYRGFRARVYSDAPMVIPGMNPAINVNAFHFSGLRWALEAGTGIIADDVGLGKTARGLMLAKLMKETGRSKKGAFVLPKSVITNWVKSAEEWFPGSSILVIGETIKRDKNGKLVSNADDAATRRQKLHDLQQNTYDFVFISSPAWNDIDVDSDTKERFSSEDFWNRRRDALGGKKQKAIDKAKTAHDQDVAKRDFKKREGTIFFEDLGLDSLIFDEGHAYKNLYSARSRWGESPKFLGGGGKSNRSLDTYYKTKALREATGGKGVYMLTATPTKNSPLEVYSMLAYIAPEAFERMGIKNSEDFLDRFCVFENDTILGLEGEFKEALVTAGFKNMGELREVMRRYIDRRTAEDVGLKLPAADRRTHIVDMTPEQELIYESLRADASGRVSDGGATAHIFSVIDRMSKAALDLELLGYKGKTSPKIDAVAKAVAASVKEGGQVIFCDSIDLHDKIANTIAAAGIPRRKIGIINGEETSKAAERQSICDDFNAGKLSVVIGNTATMGEGLNLQVGTSDVHHLDLAWEPATMQQRNGRALRQGNKQELVRINTYLSKGSFDGYRYQTVAAKADWMNLLWNGGDRIENLARAKLGTQELLIAVSKDPEAARAKFESDREAAEQRKAAEGKVNAAAEFERLQVMRENLAKMEVKGGGGKTKERLKDRIALAEELLGENPYFPHKHLLEPGTPPAVIEPVTNQAWTVGQHFRLAPGSEGPIYWGSEPSSWVITKIDREAGKITASVVDPGTERRSYFDRRAEMAFNVSAMKEGVAPITAEEAAPPPPRSPKELLHEMQHGADRAAQVKARREFDEQMADSDLTFDEFFARHGMSAEDMAAYASARRPLYG